jgi:CRISPR/Cas system-associated endonuclease Cas3-HD
MDIIENMEFSNKNICDVLEMKDRITEKIEKCEVEIEFLKKNLDILDSILKQSSFTKASELHTDSQTKKPEPIPITKGVDGAIIANAYVTPEQVSIVINNDIGLDLETPPFKSFFLDRIIGDMKRKDSTEAENGRIKKESVIDYVINKNGSNIREIIIRNYRQKDRIKEILNTAAWSLTRMIENINK